MEPEIILIMEFIEYIKTSTTIQIILLAALVLFSLAIWKEMRIIKRRRRHVKAMFASPMLGAREAFPDGYLYGNRGTHRANRTHRPRQTPPSPPETLPMP